MRANTASGFVHGEVVSASLGQQDPQLWVRRGAWMVFRAISLFAHKPHIVKNQAEGSNFLAPPWAGRMRIHRFVGDVAVIERDIAAVGCQNMRVIARVGVPDGVHRDAHLTPHPRSASQAIR